MDWKEKMKLAMIDIQNACHKNVSWAECPKCPFNDFCDIIEKEIGVHPEEWEVEDLY